MRSYSPNFVILCCTYFLKGTNVRNECRERRIAAGNGCLPKNNEGINGCRSTVCSLGEAVVGINLFFLAQHSTR